MVSVEEFEKECLQRIEEQHLEVMNHPGQWRECVIMVSVGGGIQSVYSCPENTPIEWFTELNMFRFILGHLLSEAEWQPYALRVLHYLRLLPYEIQVQEWTGYHNVVAEAYRQSGNVHKANVHSVQALGYCYPYGYVDRKAIKELFDAMELPKAKLDLGIYILSFIVENGLWGTGDYFEYWERDHYEVVEFVLKMNLLQYAPEEDKALVRLQILFLNGFYMKRTRRFQLAEKLMQEVVSGLLEEPGEYYITPSLVYLQLVEIYLELGDMEKAQHSMDEAIKHLGWDRELLEPIVVRLTGGELEAEVLEYVNSSYIGFFMSVCRERASFNASVQDVIYDWFLGPFEEEEEAE